MDHEEPNNTTYMYARQFTHIQNKGYSRDAQEMPFPFNSGSPVNVGQISEPSAMQYHTGMPPQAPASGRPTGN